MAKDSSMTAEAFQECLGLSAKDQKLAEVLKANGMKVPKVSGNFDEIAWFPSLSMRMDFFTAEHFKALTKMSKVDSDFHYLGNIDFLAKGADDRVRANFKGKLPGGLTIKSNPNEAIKKLGSPVLNDFIEGAAEKQTLLVWREGKMNYSALFSSMKAEATIETFSISMIGCLETWAITWPEVFAAK